MTDIEIIEKAVQLYKIACDERENFMREYNNLRLVAVELARWLERHHRDSLSSGTFRFVDESGNDFPVEHLGERYSKSELSSKTSDSISRARNLGLI